MSSSSWTVQLDDAAGLHQAADRADAYEALLHSILQHEVASSLPSAIHKYLQAAALDKRNAAGAGLLVGRRVVKHMITNIIDASLRPDHPLHDTTCFQAVLAQILTSCASSSVYDDELVPARLALANAYERQHAYAQAAQTLQSISPDAAQHATETSWAALCVHSLRLFWLAQDLPAADQALRRANSAIHSVRDDINLVHTYKLYQAHTYAAQQRYMEAASRFYDLALSSDDAHAQRAALCAMLATPSIQRTELLTKCHAWPSSHSWPFHTALEKAMHSRLWTSEDQASLVPFLTIYDHMLVHHDVEAWKWAIAMHNIFAASRTFTSIPFQRLATLAGVDITACVKILAQLRLQNQLSTNCTIDQRTQGVYFTSSLAASERLKRSDARIGAALQALDTAHSRLST